MTTEADAWLGRVSRPEHHAVIAALHAIDVDLLASCRCWFGGGTAIVLDIGEYRLSKDINFLCTDADGYRRPDFAGVRAGDGRVLGTEAERHRAVHTGRQAQDAEILGHEHAIGQIIC